MSEQTLSQTLRLNAGLLRQAESNIAWTLEHPAFSGWLKDTLRSGVSRDPVDLANDLELLNHLLRPWCRARIEQDRLGDSPPPCPRGSTESTPLEV